MAFTPSPAELPPRRPDPADPRFIELFTDPSAPGGASPADVHLAGVPYDASVLGRKGAKQGPTAIREAFRFLSNHDPAGTTIEALRLRDHGDVAGLDATGSDVLAAHGLVEAAAGEVFAAARADHARTVLLGGDHGLTYPHMKALAAQVEGPIGIVVIDAHYDLREYQDQPSSGTPFYRVLRELDGRVQGPNIAEIGIRPFANTRQLAERAADWGVRVHPMHEVRRDGIEAVTEAALEAAGDGTEHVWLSIDIDGLDQSIASGCSAPGAGGLTFDEAAHVVRCVAAMDRCRGLDLLEVAPSLDPTGNTARTAAQLVATACGAWA